MHHPTDRITHTTAFVTPVVEHWLEREIAQWVYPMKQPQMVGFAYSDAAALNDLKTADGLRSTDGMWYVMGSRFIVYMCFEKRYKEVFYLTTHSTHLVTVIWRRTYGKGPFR